MYDEAVNILVLLMATNGAPIIVDRIFSSRFTLAVDFGRSLSDGQPIFGTSKTWRGLAAAVILCGAISTWLGYGPGFGLVFGALGMTGDLCSSFVKRRMGLEAGARSPGLDQLPEAFLPSAYAVYTLGLEWWWAVVLALVFMLLAMLVSKPLYWIRIRKRPH